jgi:hypothetical protein
MEDAGERESLRARGALKYDFDSAEFLRIQLPFTHRWSSTAFPCPLHPASSPLSASIRPPLDARSPFATNRGPFIYQPATTAVTDSHFLRA